MQSLRVAAVSMNSEIGKRTEVMERIAEYTQRAVAEKAELILFPELIVHGHCTPNTFEIAEPIPGPSVEKLCGLAERHGVFMSVGMSEKENDIVYNAQVLVGPQGYIGKQRKIHMSRDEVLYYKGGRDINVYDIGKCKVGTVICYDNQFPEVARILALRGVDVILMPHAARQGRWEDDSPASEVEARSRVFEYFRTGYTARARENACFCVLADQAGRAGYVDIYPPEHPNQPHHPGAAMVLGPGGDLLKAAQTEKIRDEMIVCDLDAGELAAERSKPNYTLRTRRPELFSELVREQVSS